MTDNIVKFTPVEIGDGYRFDSNELFDSAKKYTFDRLLIVGELDDGELYITGNANAGEMMVLMEKVKRHIID